MTKVGKYFDDHAGAADYGAYRAVCASAVISLVIGLLAALALVNWFLCIVPFFGLLFGVLALWKIRRRPGELIGRKLAWTGIVLSIFFWATGWGWLAWDASVEVPEGYRRITYKQLQPRESSKHGLVPEFAKRMHGQKVFIRGYMYPSKNRVGVKAFLLVRDMGTCCFGGNPPLTHRIEVTLQDPHRVSYSYFPKKLIGTFYVRNLEAATKGQAASVFYLEDTRPL